MPNFERFANVTIGERGQEGILFEGERIAFKITKSNEPTPNSGEVSIWNLSEDSRNKIRTIGDAIQLQAGYVQDEFPGGRLVITADVLDIVTVKQGPDLVTVIRLGDGVEYLKTIKQTYSFKEGTSVKAILQKVASEGGITLKSMDALADANYANGFSEMGPLGDIFDKLVGRLNAQWSFQNNELQIAPKLGHNGSPVFKLSKDTGLVGIPTRDVDTSSVTPAPQSDGWKVTALLRPELGPGDRVEIETDVTDASGVFHIKEVTHSGDSYQGDWTSTLRVRESSNA